MSRADGTPTRADSVGHTGGALLVVLFLGACLWISTETARPVGDGPAASVVEWLNYSSVHVERGAELFVDADRVRRLIGDRSIVVIGVTDETPYGCEDIATGLPGVAVLWLSTENSLPASACGENNLDYEVQTTLRDANVGSDRTAYVEEYVWQFDAQEAGDEAAGRVPGPPAIDEVPVHKLVFTALFFAALTWFVCEFIYVYYRRNNFWIAHDRAWKADLNARLNRVADTLLRSDSPVPAAERASAGKRYVLLLHDFETAEKPTELGPLGRELTELETLAGVKRLRRKRSTSNDPRARQVTDLHHFDR